MPGVGTSSPEDWSNGQGGSWICSLEDANHGDTAVYCFNHGIAAGDTTSWLEILDEGREIVETLLALTSEDQVSLFAIQYIVLKYD